MYTAECREAERKQLEEVAEKIKNSNKTLDITCPPEQMIKIPCEKETMENKEETTVVEVKEKLESIEGDIDIRTTPDVQSLTKEEKEAEELNAKEEEYKRRGEELIEFENKKTFEEECEELEKAWVAERAAARAAKLSKQASVEVDDPSKMHTYYINTVPYKIDAIVQHSVYYAEDELLELFQNIAMEIVPKLKTTTINSDGNIEVVSDINLRLVVSLIVQELVRNYGFVKMQIPNIYANYILTVLEDDYTPLTSLYEDRNPVEKVDYLENIKNIILNKRNEELAEWTEDKKQAWLKNNEKRIKKANDFDEFNLAETIEELDAINNKNADQGFTPTQLNQLKKLVMQSIHEFNLTKINKAIKFANSCDCCNNDSLTDREDINTD